MRALLILELAAYSGKPPEKPEFILARAGFRAREISELVGKSEAAVAKAISRARTTKTGGFSQNE